MVLVFQEQGGYIQRDLDCLSFRLGARYTPAYTRSDGSEQEEDWRFTGLLWIRAFPSLSGLGVEY